ncbi:hypothetical protein ACQR3P_29420 [Rhodococcus sp. IEGM1300]
MMELYIGDGLLYPFEISEEGLEEGRYLPLLNGGLLRVSLMHGEVMLSMEKGGAYSGRVYGIKRGTAWATAVTREFGTQSETQNFAGDWLVGLTREEAEADVRATTAPLIGGGGTIMSVDEFAIPGEKTGETRGYRFDQEYLEGKVGESIVLSLEGTGITDRVTFRAENAVIVPEGTKVTVTPTSTENNAFIYARVQLDDGREITRMVIITVTEGDSGTSQEAPIPPESPEPPAETNQEIEYDTVIPFREPSIKRLPTLTKVTHRRRGPKESEKLNLYLIGARNEIAMLNKEEEELRSSLEALNASRLENGEEVTPVRGLLERIIVIDKPRGVGLVRIGVRSERVLSMSAKLNKASLRLSDYTMDQHGILTLSDQLKEESGRLEVEIQYEQDSENRVRLSMGELQRRARRLSERMCRVKEGLDNG